jgi:NFU1 iron-sulfur cluster scaffold homolog, mitochondrial
MKEGVKEFNSAKEASSSPLAMDLLNIEGVCSVFYGPDFITVSKDDQYRWDQLKPDIFAAIMDQYNIRGEGLFIEEKDTISKSDVAELPTDASRDTVAAIVNIIDSKIRPVVQQDGGDVEYRGFVKGYVRLRMQGACKSCSSSVITLKNGIENMLMHYIPEVRGVEQITDEAEEVSRREFRKLEGRYPKDDDEDIEHQDANSKGREDILSKIKTKPRKM